MTKDEIIASLPRMSDADREAVAGALKALNVWQGAPKAHELWDDWVLNGIATYLIRSSVLSNKGAIFELRKRTAYKVYLSKLPALMVFLNKLQANVGIMKRHQPQIAFLCASALGESLREKGIFSVSAMLSQVDKIPEALDSAYPGYIRHGLFGFVLNMGDG